MRLGLIARCDDRGLGILTWEAYRHLHPERTLVVIEPGAVAQGFEQHRDRYPDAIFVEFDGVRLDEDAVGKFLHGLDVVYSAETFYDRRVPLWADDHGVVSVLHAMPEFYSRDDPPPNEVWLPTFWRAGLFPAEARHVPIPVALDRFSPRVRDGARTLLHVVGHHAMYDRAGTTDVLRALRMMHQRVSVRLVTQDDHVARLPKPPPGIDIEYVTDSRGDYWRLYDEGDVFVAPRRYGGLSLTMNEAAASGCALVLPNSTPHEEWPAVRVQTAEHGVLRTKGGDITTNMVSVPTLAAILDDLIAHPEKVSALSSGSVQWARLHSWDALLPLYRAEFERAAA